MVPGLRANGFSLASASAVVSGRRCSSLAHGDRPGLAARHDHRLDLLGEEARGLRLRGALLRAERKRVLVLARDLVILGDVLGRLRHGVDAVLLLHQRIDEAPADGGVLDRGAPLERLLRLAHHERRARHRLDAAGDGEVDLARADALRGEAHRVQSRRAEPIDGDARHRVRQAREQQRHPRDVAVVLAGLVGAAVIDLVERRPIDIRMPLHQRLDRDRAEIVGAHLGEPAGIAADRRADGVADEGVGHRGSPESLLYHFVGAAEQRDRDGQAERLRGLEIDDKFDLGRLLDRKIGRLLALENAAGIARRAEDRSRSGCCRSSSDRRRRRTRGR